MQLQNNSKQAVVPKKAINDSAGHDVFTGEQKVLEPGSCNVVSLGVNTEISKGFFLKDLSSFWPINKPFCWLRWQHN